MSGEFGIVELRNTTNATLELCVDAGSERIVVAVLEPGASARQVMPTGTTWSLRAVDAAAPSTSSGTGDGPLDEPDDDGKGGTKKF